eukprot:160342-Pyramimonas_sp.AAC.1
MHKRKRVTEGKPVTAAPIKDAAKITTTPIDGEAETGGAHVHAHPLPAPNSAVATREELAMHPAKPKVLTARDPPR